VARKAQTLQNGAVEIVAPESNGNFMTKTQFSITVEIPAPARVAWSVISDVERWSEWTSSISRVKLLSSGPLQLGGRARVHQPRLLPAYWRVTEWRPGTGFTWVSVAPGLRVTARHYAENSGSGCRVTLSIHYEGLLGTLVARWVGSLNDRYLAMEAAGLEARCTELATKSSSN